MSPIFFFRTPWISQSLAKFTKHTKSTEVDVVLLMTTRLLSCLSSKSRIRGFCSRFPVLKRDGNEIHLQSDIGDIFGNFYL